MRRLWLRLINWLRPARADAELSREIAAHLSVLEDEFRRQGMMPDEARLAARRAFGGVEQAKELHRSERSFGWLEDLQRDVRYALRTLRRTPGFTAVVVLTLALGIGATIAVFSVVNGILIKPLPYPDSQSLVAVSHVAPGIEGLGNINMSAAQFVTYREQNRAFQDIGIWGRDRGSVTGFGEPEEIWRLTASYGTLQALGIQPAIGRWFSQEEDTAGAPATALLLHGYWRRRYASDPSVIGRTIVVDSLPRQIIGVMPDGFRFLDVQADLILPVRFDRKSLQLGQFNFDSLARLKPGITIEQANADIARMIPIWLRSWPEAGPGLGKALENARITPKLRTLKHEVVGDVSTVLWVLMGTIGIVLAIACANVANLLLVRVEGRRQQLGVQAALGASRLRISSELLAESLVLSFLGGVLGLALAFWSLRVLLAIGPATLPRLNDVTIDTSVLAFAAGMSVLSALLFGLLPIAKYAAPHIASALRGANRTASDSRERHRTRNALVIAEVALSLVLLIGSGLMIRTFVALRSVHPGFTHPDEVQLMRISIPSAQVSDPEKVFRLQHEIRDRIAALNGVANASFASSAPMEGDFYGRDVLMAEDRTYTESQVPPVRLYELIAPGFFATTGTPLLVGRDITWADVYDKRPVAMISESLAREMWRNPSTALGKRVREHPQGTWREIVGVVGDVYEDGPHQKPSATVYWPLLRRNSWVDRVVVQRSVTYTIRSRRTGTDSFLNEIRAAVWAVTPDVPVAQMRTLRDVYDGSLARTSFTLVMLATAASMALLLGIVGIYGVLAYAVTQRTREIGVRAALGAPHGQLKAMFLRYGVLLAVAGVVLGTPAAVALSRLLSGLLFGVSPLDPLTYATVGLMLVVAAAAASYLPARRAARVDPLVALRYE
jgi:putative ABC transport system permease protein